MNKGTKKEKKKKNQINKNKKKGGGQNGKLSACAPVSCSRQEPPVAARDLAGLSKDRPLVCSKAAPRAPSVLKMGL
jgi:hypothetical protein